MRAQSSDPRYMRETSQVQLVRLISGEHADVMCYLHSELDVMRARHLVSALLDRELVSAQDQTRVLTALSEIASNALRYGQRGVVCAWLLAHVTSAQRHVVKLTVKVADEGAGIQDLDWAFTDHNSSGGTLGLGLSGAKRLVDHLEVLSPIPQMGYGTIITLEMTWRRDD